MYVIGINGSVPTHRDIIRSEKVVNDIRNIEEQRKGSPRVDQFSEQIIDVCEVEVEEVVGNTFSLKRSVVSHLAIAP